MTQIERAWEDLNSRGIYTEEEAYKLFNKVGDLDLGVLVTPINFEEVNRLRKELFGGN